VKATGRPSRSWTCCDDREFSFVDATSFAVMRRRGVHQAFAFDNDFAAAGFVELR
jgi:predicted nucleic acid-binding protein